MSASLFCFFVFLAGLISQRALCLSVCVCTFSAIKCTCDECRQAGREGASERERERETLTHTQREERSGLGEKKILDDFPSSTYATWLKFN